MRRDWGFAGDCARGMDLMMQAASPHDGPRGNGARSGSDGDPFAPHGAIGVLDVSRKARRVHDGRRSHTGAKIAPICGEAIGIGGQRRRSLDIVFGGFGNQFPKP